MVQPGHPLYAEQQAQDATLATIRAQLRADRIAQANAHNAERAHLVQCSCGEVLTFITTN